jgi:hypothetical protein
VVGQFFGKMRFRERTELTDIANAPRNHLSTITDTFAQKNSQASRRFTDALPLPAAPLSMKILSPSKRLIHKGSVLLVASH